MRRTDHEITDISILEDIINQCQVCRLGLSDNGQPYVVPVNFGYKNKTLYFHSAREGRKLDIIHNNPRVCVEFDNEFTLKPGKIACKWGAKYRSVIGFGTASIIDEPDSKREVLDIIMGHYTDGPFEYSKKQVTSIVIIQVEIDTLTGKASQ